MPCAPSLAVTSPSPWPATVNSPIGSCPEEHVADEYAEHEDQLRDVGHLPMVAHQVPLQEDGSVLLMKEVG